MTATSKTTTDLNLRSSPEVTPKNILKTLPSGTEFTAGGNVNKWLRAQHDGAQGFVNGDFTTSLAPAAAAPLWTTKVTSGALNLRAEASMGAAIVSALPEGAQLEVLGHDEGWLHVRHNGTLGFVAANRTESMVDVVMHSTQPGELGALMSKPKLSTSEMVKARQLINDIGDADTRGDLFEALQGKTAYRNQRDNQAKDAAGNLVETRSGNMCNLTSLAMCLSYLGIFNPTPNIQFEDVLEGVRVKHNLPARTDARGWGGVAAKMGAKVKFLGSNKTDGQAWYTANVLPSLRAGNAVMMSCCGHIVRVQGVTGEGLIIDDPYGKGRMKPNAGCTDLQWKYDPVNEYQQPNQRVGEDNVWPWGDVSNHCMRWIAEISRVGLGADEPEPPTEPFVDEGTVVPGQAN